MFFGLEVKTNQNQAKPQVLNYDIKLSQAVLDPATVKGKKEPVCLFVEQEKKQYLVAVLDPSLSWQAPIDLMLSGGSEVRFFVRGNGTVHLTGFELEDEDYDDLDDMSLMSDDEFSDEDTPGIENGPARKKVKAIEANNETPAVKGKNNKQVAQAKNAKGAQQLTNSAGKSPKANGVKMPVVAKNGKANAASPAKADKGKAKAAPQQESDDDSEDDEDFDVDEDDEDDDDLDDEEMDDLEDLEESDDDESEEE